MMQLTDYLLNLAQVWADANGRTLGALGTTVANDGKFFTRMAAGTAPRVTTFQRFLGFFRNGDNWPDNVIPMAATDLLDRLENIASETGVSATGQVGDLSRELVAAGAVHGDGPTPDPSPSGEGGL